MNHEYQTGDEVVLRLSGTATGTTTVGGEVTAYRIALESGDQIVLTPERLAAAAAAEQARDVLLGHLLSGEPLGEGERDLIVAAGLCGSDCFDYTGGGLYRHLLLQCEEE